MTGAGAGKIRSPIRPWLDGTQRATDRADPEAEDHDHELGGDKLHRGQRPSLDPAMGLARRLKWGAPTPG